MEQLEAPNFLIEPSILVTKGQLSGGRPFHWPPPTQTSKCPTYRLVLDIEILQLMNIHLFENIPESREHLESEVGPSSEFNSMNWVNATRRLVAVLLGELALT